MPATTSRQALARPFLLVAVGLLSACGSNAAKSPTDAGGTERPALADVGGPDSRWDAATPEAGSGLPVDGPMADAPAGDTRTQEAGAAEATRTDGASPDVPVGDGPAPDAGGDVSRADTPVTDGPTADMRAGQDGGADGAPAVDADTSGIIFRHFGTAKDDSANSVVADSDGNIYVAGGTDLSTDIYHNSSIYLGKWDSRGNVLWAKEFGTNLLDSAQAVAIDRSGTPYIAGFVDNHLPGEQGDPNMGLMLGRFDSSGQQVWMIRTGHSVGDSGNAVAVDGSGNVFLAGYTTGTILPGQIAKFATTNAYLGKYDGAGQRLWTREFGVDRDKDGDNIARIDAATVDGSGNIYVVGTTTGTLPGQTGTGLVDVFVRKYDSAGTELWTRQFGSSKGAESRSAVVDGKGNLYVGGWASAALTGSSETYSGSAFLRKYDSAGTELWTKTFGAAAAEAGALAWTTLTAMFVDAAGNLYLTGATPGAFPGQTNAGKNDVYVRKVDASGNALWTRQFGTSEVDSPLSVAASKDGKVYVVGNTSGAFPGQTNRGWTDAFLAILSP